MGVISLLAQACNLERVLDPSLPTYTPQPEVTPTSRLISEPTPVATLSNEARVEVGDLLFFYGDWDSALREYQGAFEESEDVELEGAALLGMARCFFEQDQITAAREAVNVLVDRYADTAAAAGAYILRARIYGEFEDFANAAADYQTYLELRPGIIDATVQEWRGDDLYAAADYMGAISAYESAIQAPKLNDNFGILIKVGNAFAASKDYESAIATYQNVYDNTPNDYLKADADYLMGRAYSAMGNETEATARYQDAVDNFPLAYSSYAALVELVQAGIPVDELQRGIIDYYTATTTTDVENAQELYGVAISALDRYLASAPAEHDGTAHFFRARALEGIEDYITANQEWDHIINEHQFSEHWVDAYSEKAFTQWVDQEDYEGAINTLLSFVASTPSQEAAAEFLFTAGRIAERGGRLTRATEIWPRVANEYPSSEYAYDALFLTGITFYRLENYASAQSFFLRAYQASLSLEEGSQSLFWIGKALQAQGDDAGALNAWEQTSVVDPTGYYTERAKDLLAGREAFEPPANYSFDIDLEADRLEAEAWVRSTFALPPEDNLSNPGALASDPRFQRGTELWKLGEYEMARAEFESLRETVAGDPANSFRLANYTVDLGLYRTAIFAAREVLNLAGMSDAGTMNAPVYFNRLRFGAYYKEIVLPAMVVNRLDPLFFYAMMRQESLFEGFVTSSAGARGLMQIIPATGQEVATLYGWPPNFAPEDLYRPHVSIRLGAHYLAIQLNAFDGDIYAALAAYNAGPGNASYWSSLANGDQDLYLEVVHFEETRNHIRSIYELFTIYRNLYSLDETQ
ncbi:MAG: transglycosylase SLT domain-containing protein [Anaerolineales bacterium]